MVSMENMSQVASSMENSDKSNNQVDAPCAIVVESPQRVSVSSYVLLLAVFLLCIAVALCILKIKAMEDRLESVEKDSLLDDSVYQEMLNMATKKTTARKATLDPVNEDAEQEVEEERLVELVDGEERVVEVVDGEERVVEVVEGDNAETDVDGGEEDESPPEATAPQPPTRRSRKA